MKHEIQPPTYLGTYLSKYKHIGIQNGWGDAPPEEYAACIKMGHKHRPVRAFRPDEHWRTYVCDMCHFKYEVDSS